ncbi:MAG: tRNA (adenosine(37)-N6)-threonylcarbamoyltransferase complex ATPase subunit type 1 TsaE [Puniceicoccales bacterium]|nr:tRNA (adenosine(37)-N6)-threonylcarbamoyltransferase complex ATPase subunit type 1 TsaE [Puniceicoccales bacterium]
MTLFEKLENGVVCTKAEDLIDLGEAFGQLLCDGDVVALHGDLGVGKTTFTKGIGKAFQITDVITSPTFNIMAQYYGAMNLIHIDAYRLDDHGHLEVLDYIRHPCVIVVEWPENLVELRDNITRDIRIVMRESGERWVTLRC